ncbi:hypothetical protein Tco_1546006, partial [Tanacetum coccineum]
WVSDDELEAPEEAPQFPELAPPSPNYVPGPEHPPSPDYVPGTEHPPSPYYPLSVDASPTTLSLGYVADSDHEEDLEEDPADYPVDGRDDEEEEEESFEDDGDDEDEEEDSEDENEEEEEHLALTNSTTLPVVDLVPSSEDTEAFETVESLGYMSDPRHRCQLLLRAAMTASPPTHHPSEIPSPPLFEVGESSSADAARQAGYGRGKNSVSSRELVRTVEAGPQDGPADAGSSC